MFQKLFDSCNIFQCGLDLEARVEVDADALGVMKRFDRLCIVWADAPKKSYVISDVLKCVYDTLGNNGIEIPFPQRDIHIVK